MHALLIHFILKIKYSVDDSGVCPRLTPQLICLQNVECKR